MPVVYFRSSPRKRARFHRSDSCHQLLKNPARGAAFPIISVDLADLPMAPHPCLDCYPDARADKITRRFCPECNVHRALPCPHNGGVRIQYVYRSSRLGESSRSRWVWPDRAWLYENLASH